MPLGDALRPLRIRLRGDTFEISAKRIGQTVRAEGSIGASCLGSAQRHGEFAVRPGSLVSGVKDQHHAHAAGWLALLLRCPGDQAFDGDFGFGFVVPYPGLPLADERLLVHGPRRWSLFTRRWAHLARAQLPTARPPWWVSQGGVFCWWSACRWWPPHWWAVRCGAAAPGK